MWQQRYDQIHNYPGTLPNTSHSDVISNTKIIFQNLLFNYFNSLNLDFVKRGVEVDKFRTHPNMQAKARDITDPINIVREFPFNERKFPFIVVSITEIKDKKLYLGFDNIGHAAVHQTHNGMLVGELSEFQSYFGTAQLSVAAKTVDDRDRLIGYCGSGFQNYFRSNYKWVNDDLKNTFFLHTGYDEVEYELDPSPINDGAGGDIFKVYAGNIKMKFMLEHYYSTIDPALIDRSEYNISGGTIENLDVNPHKPG